MPRISASLKEFSPLMTALLDAKMDMRLLLRKKPLFYCEQVLDVVV